jgi:hypothetical protein
LQASQSSTSTLPAPSSPLPTDTAGLQEIVNQAAKTVQSLTSQVQSITNPVPANTIKFVTSPTLPAPTASSIQSSFIGGIQQNLDATRKAFEDSIKAERANLETQRKQYETQIADLTSKQQGTIQNDIQPLLQPFRENLEKTERERLKVEENYFENQKIVNEIQTLANGLQQDIATVQGVAAPAAIQQAKIGKIKEDSLARIGVLQAVVSIRNGQISTAFNLIDRSTQAILADRQDRLNYFNTLLNFYEGQKDEAGKKLIEVKKQDLDYVKTQQSLLESDLASAQKSFDNIKNMMTDPTKADALARAGVKLTDTPEEVNKKLSDYSYTQEKFELDSQFIKDGYEYLPFPEMLAGKSESRLLRIKDSRGVARVYYQKVPPKVAGTTTTVQDQENSAAVNLYTSTLEAAIQDGATPAEAVAAAAALADATGTKLDLRNQNALLTKAQAIYQSKQTQETKSTAPSVESLKLDPTLTSPNHTSTTQFSSAISNYLFGK